MATLDVDLPFNRPHNEAGKRISFALALAVHLMLAMVLFYGIRWQTKSPDAVEVELVRSVPLAVSPAPTFEPKPVPVPEPRRIEPKPEPKLQPPKPDIAIKEKERPPIPKEEPRPKVDPFQEELKRESEKFSQQQKVDTAARELNAVKSAQASAARNKAVADYLSRIRGKIRGNIVLPPEIKGNPEAIFEVTQLPSGEIINVKLKKSSGNTALDSAVERAIFKSSPLPKPEQSDIFERLLNIPYRPLEN